MLRLARFGVPLGVAMALVIGVQGNAFAFNTTHVAIVNFAFSPASVTITWATGVPSGYTFNVQISRPTGGGFTPFLTGTTMLSTMFTPDAGTGTYMFRAQIQQTANPSLKSGFSPKITITVS